MKHSELIQLAQAEGFSAAVIPMDKVVFDHSFRRYCEDNVCGQYGAHYTCPPDCGEPEEMQRRLTAYPNALVLQTRWNISDYRDVQAIRAAKLSHNNGMLRIIDRLHRDGHAAIMAGASNCTLCDRCAILDSLPCPDPENRFSCLSAYCVYVKQLAEDCGMEYFSADGSICFFGICALS